MLAAFTHPESFGSLLVRDVLDFLIMMQPTAFLIERITPLPPTFKRFSVDQFNTVYLHDCIQPMQNKTQVYPVKAYSLNNSVTMDIRGTVRYNDVKVLGPGAYDIHSVMVGDRMIHYKKEDNKIYILFVFETLMKVSRCRLKPNSQILIKDNLLYIATPRNMYVLNTDHLPFKKCRPP